MRKTGGNWVAGGLLALGVSGCQQARTEDPFAGPSSGSASGLGDTGQLSEGGGGEESTGEESGTSDGTSSDDGGIPVFDLAGGEGGDPLPEDDGCKKVDLLFVIDNSDSMSGEQSNLIASFPGFIDTMRQTLANADNYHIGVTTTDANGTNAADCRMDGALVTVTGGENSSNQQCGPYLEGGAYMTGEDDLDTSFPCAAQVGTAGIPFERPMDTLRAAIGPAHHAPGGCNEGFIRDDALLVVVIISDEEDHLDSQVIQNGSAGDPGDWFSDVVALKGGIEENIVVLSLVGVPAPNACPVNGGEHEGAEVASRIIEFTGMFTHGSVGDVCADSYEGFFADAIEVIDVACEGFTPAG